MKEAITDGYSVQRCRVHAFAPRKEFRHQVTKRKAPCSGAVVESVCIMCHICLAAYHRASPNVGWSRFRAVLMLAAFYLRQASGGMARKFWNVINRSEYGTSSDENKVA